MTTERQTMTNGKHSETVMELPQAANWQPMDLRRETANDCTRQFVRDAVASL